MQLVELRYFREMGIVTEYDPTGRDQHQPGAKLDGGQD